MKAAYYIGDKTIKFGQCNRVIPNENQVEINIAYCGICGTDLHIFNGVMDKRVSVPHVMGHECSGVVTKIGSNVSNINIGDRVVVRPLDPCGDCPACKAGHSHICYNLDFLGIEKPGAMQSYWTVPENTIHKIPDSLSLKHAALIEPLAVACHDVRTSGLKNNENVVVIGGGPIGMLISLVSRSVGANVLISEINEYRLNFASNLGFQTVNPKEVDVIDYVNKWTGGVGADVVFEVSASDAGAGIMTELLRTRGRIVVVGIFSHVPKVDLHKFFWKEIRLFGARVYEKEDYEKAIKLAASNTIQLDSIVTKTAPLDDLQKVLEDMTGNQQAMKTLIKCSE